MGESSNNGQQQKWRLSLLTAAVLMTMSLYFFFSIDWNNTEEASWSKDELDAGSPPIIDLQFGHGPVLHPSSESNSRPNDAAIRLHPEDHINRDPKTIEIEWNITKAVLRPDGVAKQVYLVNGAFPGPAIECRSGDELRIVVRNELEEEGVALHWHGLRGVENDMDGVVGVTQCAILQGTTMTYQLKVQDHGSFWWHSHSIAQRSDGLFGPLIVHKPAEVEVDPGVSYDFEQLLMIGDWYHRSANEILKEYQEYKTEPAPDSMLMNGRGFFACPEETAAQAIDCKEPKVPFLSVPDRTRLRIVNTGALTGISIAMTGYTMTLLEIGGGQAVEARSSSGVGILYPGERVDVIVERLDQYTSAWITITLDQESLSFPNLALTAEQQFPVATPARLLNRDSLNHASRKVSWIDLASVDSTTEPVADFPQVADEVVLLYSIISYLHRPKGFINRTSWSPSRSPGLPLLALPASAWPENVSVSVHEGHWVDLVINNVDERAGHVFHLHGQSFYVLGVRDSEQYNPFESKKVRPFNLDNPVKKDTIYVRSMGYAVLRFKADNVGLWMLRCQVLLHEALGLNMIIAVRAADEVRWVSLKDQAEAHCQAQVLTSSAANGTRRHDETPDVVGR